MDLNEAKNKPIASKYGIRGYPTLKIFENGEPKEFKGPRDSKGIVSYLSSERKVTTRSTRFFHLQGTQALQS